MPHRYTAAAPGPDCADSRLRERGAAPISQMAFVFDGKRVHGERLAEA